MIGMLAIAATAPCGTIGVFGQPTEKDSVLMPLENYIKAQAKGDPKYARRAFQTEDSMTWIREGNYVSEPFYAFIKRAFTGKPATDEEERKEGGGSKPSIFPAMQQSHG